MFKIPNQTKSLVQKNDSDLTGTIWQSKNITLNDKGYVKLSPRSVSLLSETTDSDLGLPVSFGRTTNGTFNIATTDDAFILSISDNGLSITQDTDSGVPSLSFKTFGLWWRNLWHVSTTTKVYSKSGSTWTEQITGLTSTVQHPLCDFSKTRTLLIGNGNIIKQVDNTYAEGTLAQLTLSTDYEVVSIAYNNGYAGIATRLANTIEGQNKEAVFFTWDGSESSANQSFGIGSDACVITFPYKSSFVVINRKGHGLYFNGGGFEKIFELPIGDAYWGDFLNVVSYGDNIVVDGDDILFNITSKVDKDSGDFIDGLNAGVWCYNPDNGLYHKYSPSISTATQLYSATQDTSTNIFSTSNTVLDTGNPVLATSVNSGGLHNGEVYYIIKVSSTQFKLATTKANALALNPIDITSSGGSYFIALNLKDYGQSRGFRAGGVALYGDRNYSYDKVVFGYDLFETASQTSATYNLCSIINRFKNIGYYTIPKMESDNITDTFQKVYIKYKPLDTDDTITIKYRDKDVVGLPEIASCTATSNTILTTTDYIPKSYAYTEELECEVISGAGAGQMVKVSSITESSGTYTITLSSELDGVVATDKLSIKLDNWVEVGTITTSDSLGYKELPLAKLTKWAKFKVVMSGYNVVVEELQVINSNHIPSK